MQNVNKAKSVHQRFVNITFIIETNMPKRMLVNKMINALEREFEVEQKENIIRGARSLVIEVSEIKLGM